MTELKNGQSVWVKSALKEGIFLERKIYEVNDNLGRGISYYLSSGGLEMSYHKDDLVTNAEEAKKICHQALKKAKNLAEKNLRDFAGKFYGKISEPTLAWGVD